MSLMSEIQSSAQAMQGAKVPSPDTNVNHALNYLSDTVNALEEAAALIYERTVNICRDASPTEPTKAASAPDSASSVHREIVGQTNKIRGLVNGLNDLSRRIDL